MGLSAENVVIMEYNVKDVMNVLEKYFIYKITKHVQYMNVQ